MNKYYFLRACSFEDPDLNKYSLCSKASVMRVKVLILFHLISGRVRYDPLNVISKREKKVDTSKEEKQDVGNQQVKYYY